MLVKAEPSKTPDNNFSVCDIENDAAGNVLAIGISWRECGAIQHRVFSEWEDWWVWLVSQAKQRKTFRKIYAHNGGGWDWLSFLQWFVKTKRHEGVSVGMVEAQSKLVFLEIGFTRKHGDTERSRLTIRLCDSLYLLRSKLNDLAKKILGKEKTEAKIEDVWDAWENDKPRFYAYLQSDCQLLLEILEQSLDLIRLHVAKIKSLGMTIGSCALKIFRTIGWGSDDPIDTTMPEHAEKLCREGYHGGRVEVFKHGYFPTLNVYDVNSLYPFAMVSTAVPISGRGIDTMLYRPGAVGCYRVEWRQRRKDIPPVLLGTDGNGSYEGVGVVYSPELELLQRIDCGATIFVRQGYQFMDTGKPFTEFVTQLYRLRLSDKNGAVGLLVKFLLNSLYGKFGQRQRREKLIAFDSWEAALEAEKENHENNAKLSDKRFHRELLPIDPTTFREGTPLYTESESVRVDHAHVGIAGMITSRARVALYERILQAGSDTVVYCDTDSIHTTGANLHADISPDLGAVKLEASGEGVYCGKKLYAIKEYRSANLPANWQFPIASEKVRAKGISVGGKFGTDLRFNHLLEIAKGNELICNFDRPATFRAILLGVQSCKMDASKRKRKIRKT
jgi:hypothetical protein